MFSGRYTQEVRHDLLRLFDFLLDRAQTIGDFDAAQAAVDSITSAVDRNLARSPFIHRKVGDNPFLREPIVPFGNSGYVALHEIEDAATITILAVRLQREDDYH